jgi:hypothetical protein
MPKPKENDVNDEEFKDKYYLGDGLYCGHDGYHVWLWCDRDGTRHFVALEPHVMTALELYVKRLQEKYQEVKS